MSGTQIFWMLIILGVLASFTTMFCVSIAHSHTENRTEDHDLPQWSSTTTGIKPDEKDLK